MGSSDTLAGGAFGAICAVAIAYLGGQVFYGGDFADAWPWLCIITVPVFVPLGLGLGFVADLSQVLNKKDSAGFVKRKLNRTRDAAEQGRAKAQHNLGNKYRHGEGVARDYAEAAKWYRKAAEQGLAVAQYNLGLMHASGIGVPRNDIESYVWFLVAAATGHRRAKKSLAKVQLTPEQLATAEERAAELLEQINANKAK